MRVDMQCFLCCAKKAAGLLEQYRVPDEKAALLMREIFGELSRTEEETSAPVLMAEMMEVLEERVGISDAYEKPKRLYNGLLMEKAEEVYREIQSSSDPFLLGLRYALTGNYIDFGAMDAVCQETLEELLGKCRQVSVNQWETERLRKSLSEAERMVYITDNAGEIVLDGLWLQTIQRLYPGLEITVLVRGRPILNDATGEDARFVGLDRQFRVLDNGTGIPGTVLEKIRPQARQAIEEADVVIAKGQGNFESLHGCGRNVYYLFLCKCELFVRKFQMERYAPVVISENLV